jgi:hypothetical protein
MSAIDEGSETRRKLVYNDAISSLMDDESMDSI